MPVALEQAADQRQALAEHARRAHTLVRLLVLHWMLRLLDCLIVLGLLVQAGSTELTGRPAEPAPPLNGLSEPVRPSASRNEDNEEPTRNR